MHLVRAASLTGFAELARTQGGQPAKLLQSAGLPADTLDPVNEDRYLAHRRFEQLLQLAVERCDNPLFAVELGSRQELSMLGLLGFVMQQASDVGAALGELQRYFYLQARGSSVRLAHHGERVCLEFDVAEAHRLPSIARSAELCLAAGNAIMRTLSGGRWRPLGIHFAHRPLARPRDYFRMLAAPVVFNAGHNAVWFAASTLTMPIGAADQHLGRILHRYLDLLDERYPDDTPALVRHLIRRALSSGNCSAANIGAFMGMHRRTLHRLLDAHNTSFKTLTRQVRHDLAVTALRDSDMPVTLLADMLGYSETSAFSRAFRQWTGVTPAQYRRRREVPAG